MNSRATLFRLALNKNRPNHCTGRGERERERRQTQRTHRTSGGVGEQGMREFSGLRLGQGANGLQLLGPSYEWKEKHGSYEVTQDWTLRSAPLKIDHKNPKNNI